MPHTLKLDQIPGMIQPGELNYPGIGDTKSGDPQRARMFGKLLRGLRPALQQQTAIVGEHWRGQRSQVWQRADGPRHHNIERTDSSAEVFNARRHAFDLRQAQGATHLAHKAHLFRHRVNRHDLQIGAINFQGNAGKARARANIKQPGLRFQRRRTGARQRVGEMRANHHRRVGITDQVDARIPFLQILKIKKKRSSCSEFSASPNSWTASVNWRENSCFDEGICMNVATKARRHAGMQHDFSACLRVCVTSRTRLHALFANAEP